MSKLTPDKGHYHTYRMLERNDKIDGPFLVEEDLRFFGLITSGATVRSGVVLELHGTISGNLIVEKGGRAIVHGTVNGTVRNYGDVAVYGTIDDIADAAPDCHTFIGPDAVVRKQRRWRGKSFPLRKLARSRA